MQSLDFDTAYTWIELCESDNSLGRSFILDMEPHCCEGRDAEVVPLREVPIRLCSHPELQGVQLEEAVHNRGHLKGLEGEFTIDPDGQRLQARSKVGEPFEPAKVRQRSVAWVGLAVLKRHLITEMAESGTHHRLFIIWEKTGPVGPSSAPARRNSLRLLAFRRTDTSCGLGGATGAIGSTTTTRHSRSATLSWFSSTELQSLSSRMGER